MKKLLILSLFLAAGLSTSLYAEDLRQIMAFGPGYQDARGTQSAKKAVKNVVSGIYGAGVKAVVGTTQVDWILFGSNPAGGSPIEISKGSFNGYAEINLPNEAVGAHDIVTLRTKIGPAPHRQVYFNGKKTWQEGVTITAVSARCNREGPDSACHTYHENTELGKAMSNLEKAGSKASKDLLKDYTAQLDRAAAGVIDNAATQVGGKN